MERPDEPDEAAPLISVIVPVFNGENYLGEALRSVLTQNYQSLEIVVVDDGSDHPETISAICANCHDDRVRLFQKENGGVSSALNLGIANARGSLFAWLSHDDLFLPGKLAHQVSLWRASGASPNRILFSNYTLIDEQGSTTSQRRLERDLAMYPCRLAPLTRGLVNGCTILMDLNALRGLGRFDESLRCTQDYDMWLRAASSGFEFSFDAQPTVATRLHGAQTSRLSAAVAAENTALWLRLAQAAVADAAGKTAGSHARELNEFIEFVTHAKYLADCDLSEAVELVRREATELLAHAPRNLVVKELWRHRLAMIQLDVKRRGRAFSSLAKAQRMLAMMKGRR